MREPLFNESGTPPKWPAPAEETLAVAEKHGGILDATGSYVNEILDPQHHLLAKGLAWEFFRQHQGSKNALGEELKFDIQMCLGPYPNMLVDFVEDRYCILTTPSIEVTMREVAFLAIDAILELNAWEDKEKYKFEKLGLRYCRAFDEAPNILSELHDELSFHPPLEIFPDLSVLVNDLLFFSYMHEGCHILHGHLLLDSEIYDEECEIPNAQKLDRESKYWFDLFQEIIADEFSVGTILLPILMGEPMFRPYPPPKAKMPESRYAATFLLAVMLLIYVLDGADTPENKPVRHFTAMKRLQSMFWLNEEIRLRHKYTEPTLISAIDHIVAAIRYLLEKDTAYKFLSDAILPRASIDNYITRKKMEDKKFTPYWDRLKDLKYI